MADYQTALGEERNAGYYPVLVSATGAGAAARISGTFEQLPANEATELTLDQDRNTFMTEASARADQGWVIRSATI